MNILLATDNNYIKHCIVTMVSILENNRSALFFILTEGLSADNIQKINQTCEKYNSSAEIITVPTNIVSQFPMPKNVSDHISIATYYRLFASELLPNSINKIIYLDCDIVVRKSLDELWSISLDNYAIAAVYQNNEWSDSNHSWERLSISRKDGYFNAGVLFLNLQYWRENKVKERLLEYIRLHYDSIRSHDQDVLNAVLSKEVCSISCNWNFLPLYFNYRQYTFPDKVNNLDDIAKISKSPSVVHFVFKPKPWEYGCTHPFKNDYFLYLDKSVFNGWRPSFSIKSYWHYVLAPAIIRCDIFNLRKIIKLFR